MIRWFFLRQNPKGFSKHPTETAFVEISQKFAPNCPFWVQIRSLFLACPKSGVNHMVKTYWK
tara:strand:+ start:440 stop:625 length:186 start_codon:yes stop_codon:yes gene_type:complete